MNVSTSPRPSLSFDSALLRSGQAKEGKEKKGPRHAALVT